MSNIKSISGAELINLIQGDYKSQDELVEAAKLVAQSTFEALKEAGTPIMVIGMASEMMDNVCQGILEEISKEVSKQSAEQEEV